MGQVLNDTSAQIAQDTGQVVVATDGQDVQHAIPQRWSSGRDDGQPTAEADSNQPDSEACCQTGVDGEPKRHPFDVIGERARDRESSQAGISGVTTVRRDLASSRAKAIRRGSSMPAGCNPETSNRVWRAVAAGA